MNRRVLRAASGAAVVVALLLGSTGCGTTMRDLPIPGTGVSGDTIEVQMKFDEALNLAEGAAVKVNGVDSGKVKSITADDFAAVVTMDIKTNAELREGATARLRYTTPLGELFIDISNPAEGKLVAEGDMLDRDVTDTAPTVEDALAQASLLINGGGLAQLQIINDELNTALVGNETNYRDLLTKAQLFLTQANQTTASIDAVLTGLNSLSGTLAAREETINRAMREIRPAAAVLRRATPELTELLSAVEDFAGAANATVNATKDRLLALLSETEPVLAELAANRGRFSEQLRGIIKAADIVDEVAPNDFLMLSIDLHLDGLDLTNIPLLEDLLDLIGLDDLVPDLLGRTAPDRAAEDDAGTADDADDGSDNGDALDQLSLDALLEGLTGGNS